MSWIENLKADARYAARLMRRSPAFTTVAVLSLAIGIGANTAIFSLVDSLALKKLPVRSPAELVWLKDPGFSYPIFEQVQARAEMFSGVFAWTSWELHVDWEGEPVRTDALLVSEDFHDTLGLRPAAGRLLTARDRDSAAAVISHSCWMQRFSRDPAAVGKTIRVERVPFTIVGVTPPEFFGAASGKAPEIIIPLRMLPVIRPEEEESLTQPGRAWLHVMGRRRPGLTHVQADAAFQVIWPEALRAALPAAVKPDMRERFLGRKTSLVAGGTGFSPVRREFLEPLLLLLGLVAVVLLIVCANIAGLLLARGAARQKELAVRLSLGAGRGRILRQMLTESLLLAAMGGAVGLLVASWAASGLVALLSTSSSSVTVQFSADWRVLGFTAAAALASVLIFGAAPAWRATRLDPAPALKENARSMPGSGRHLVFGRILVIGQIGLCAVLLTGAGLLAGSLRNVLARDPGFDPKNLLLVIPDAAVAGYKGSRLAALYEEMLVRVSVAPGVRSASLSWLPPVSDQMGQWTESIAIDGKPITNGAEWKTYFNAVSPGYFETLGTELLIGRDFTDRDRDGAPGVVIINESLARGSFPGVSPIGRRISVGRDEARQNLEIVGVVQDSRYQTLQEPERRIAYLPYRQLPELDGGVNLTLTARTAGDLGSTTEAIRRTLRGLDRDMPLQFQTLESRIGESLVKERVLAVLSGCFAATALLLACLGLYGLLSYSVGRRTAEIGVRMALGAQRRDVLLLVMRETLVLLGAGILVGAGAALLATRVLESLLFGLSAADPATLAIAAVVLLATGLAAGYLPARRASRLDPGNALRSE